MIDVECHGDDRLAPITGRHEWGRARPGGKGEERQVCGFCGTIRSKPRDVGGREIVYRSREHVAKPSPRIVGWPAPPSRVLDDPKARGGNVRHAQFATLAEHQTSLRLRGYKTLDRAEATALGYPGAEIVGAWPDP